MIVRTFGCSVQGYSHVLQHKPRQDAYARANLGHQVAVVAIADGHGSSHCPFSADGARFAARAFCRLIKNMYKQNASLQDLRSMLKDDASLIFTKRLQRSWTDAILTIHKSKGRKSVDDDGNHYTVSQIQSQYGTTLLGLFVTPEFHFLYQIGDGDIMSVTSDKATVALTTSHFLGTETYSLSSSHPERYAVSSVLTVSSAAPYVYTLTTDGFKNSFASDQIFCDTCVDYVRTAKANGIRSFRSCLPQWLSETSQGGCGDDVTMAIVAKNYDF